MNEIFYSTLAAVPTAHALVLPADSDASLVVGVDAQAKTPIQAKAIANQPGRQPSGQFLFSLRCLSVAAAVARRVKICCLCCCCCAKLCWVIKSAVDNDDGASLDRQPCRAHLSSQQLAFVAHRTLRSPLSHNSPLAIHLSCALKLCIHAYTVMHSSASWRGLRRSRRVGVSACCCCCCAVAIWAAS